MASSGILSSTILLFFLAAFPSSPVSAQKLFTEYIGAQFTGVKFTDVPINPGVEFHFILSFVIDYDTTAESSPTPTDGKFSIFWDTANLSPSDVSSIKSSNSNVKVAVSLGGATVNNVPVLFSPSSVATWVGNAVSSLTSIIEQYNLDGIDIDYEQFSSAGDDNTFAECIGQLVTSLKNNGVISFATIAPFDVSEVQSHYQALWNKYGQVFDYVNFQFYAYDKSTTVSQFLNYYDTQTSNYNGGKILASFLSTGSKGLTPNNGFFDACNTLKQQGKLPGIFVWCADDSKANGFKDDTQAQQVLAS